MEKWECGSCDQRGNSKAVLRPAAVFGTEILRSWFNLISYIWNSHFYTMPWLFAGGVSGPTFLAQK